MKWFTMQMWKENRYCDNLVIYFAKKNNCELFFLASILFTCAETLNAEVDVFFPAIWEG